MRSCLLHRRNPLLTAAQFNESRLPRIVEDAFAPRWQAAPPGNLQDLDIAVNASIFHNAPNDVNQRGTVSENSVPS